MQIQINTDHNMAQAVDGATGKLTNLIESTLGRQRDQDRRRTDPPPRSELKDES